MNANSHPLKVYRDANSIALEELAMLAGTTRSTLSRIESGAFLPSADLAIRVADATGGNVSIDQIIRASAAARGRREEAA